MVKPLRTDDPAPQNMQFSHFGVLNDGSQSKASLLTSISLNVVLAFVVVVIGAAAKHTIAKHKLESISLAPIKKVEPEPIKPKIIPKIQPPPPPVAKVDAPKIKLPDLKVPEPPKPPEIKMATPVPVILPAPPKVINPPPAPKIVNLAQNAAVVNNTAKATTVALGQQNNPIAPSPNTTTAINLGNKGLANMTAANNGGPTAVTLGSGAPNGSGHDNGPAVKGVKLGVVGGTGPMNAPGRVAGPVNLGQNLAPAMPKPAAPTATAVRSGPKVIFKPRPEYTAEATRLRIEGVVSVRIHVSASGAVQVLGVTSDLGHGLGESAVRAIEGTKFQPATDASGQPTDWDGVVNVAFQLAG